MQFLLKIAQEFIDAHFYIIATMIVSGVGACVCVVVAGGGSRGSLTWTGLGSLHSAVG
jgi:hypothetical protein